MHFTIKHSTDSHQPSAQALIVELIKNIANSEFAKRSGLNAIANAERLLNPITTKPNFNFYRKDIDVNGVVTWNAIDPIAPITQYDMAGFGPCHLPNVNLAEGWCFANSMAALLHGCDSVTQYGIFSVDVPRLTARIALVKELMAHGRAVFLLTEFKIESSKKLSRTVKNFLLQVQATV